MSAITIKYAYVQGQTWMYRRNFPKDVQVVLGRQALKQTLRTGDAKDARLRAAEINVQWEELVGKVRAKADVCQLKRNRLQSVPVPATIPEGATPEEVWEQASRETARVMRAAIAGHTVTVPPILFTGRSERVGEATVDDLAKRYLRKRGGELRPGGYKSVRYSVGLLASKFAGRPIGSLTRDDGREFIGLIAQLSPVVGKSERSRRLSLDQAVKFSLGSTTKIKAVTQKRIFSQANHFLDWTVYEGCLDRNPFHSVRQDLKVRPAPYAVPTDEEVVLLLRQKNWDLHRVFIWCLLTGMRAGEAAGLLREDLVTKGNLGTFALVRPNSIRELKTDASERVVPLHGVLEAQLANMPQRGALFPSLTVPLITKGFSIKKKVLGLDRPGLVFHSTRKWFITQCERTGVPEHFTASIVGHKSARSENKLTYSIYSAGISDEQKRRIIDQIKLPI